MARLPRVVLPGCPLHIIQRGNNRQATFYTEADCVKYLEVLRRVAGEHSVYVHAYVLMTNHVHLLVTPEHKESLSLTMQSLGRQYVRYINKQYNRSGTLWEGRFKSALIDSERYLLTCYRYIELNPVRAGIVRVPGEYRWSSYQNNAFGQECRYVTPHRLYVALGETIESRQERYRALFRLSLDCDTLQLIRERTQKNTSIGDHKFQKELQAMLKRRVMKHSHGGDRKSKEFRQISSDLTP